MVTHLFMLVFGLLQPAHAESACDSGCMGEYPWGIGPQLDGDTLPTNTRLLILGADAPTVTDGDGAVVATSTSPAPGGSLWVTPTAGTWSAGATYTLTSPHGSERLFTIGDSADSIAPTASATELTLWNFSTCNATYPVVDVVATDLSDDSGSLDLFADLRVAGAPDDEALWMEGQRVEATFESSDSCFPGLTGVENGDTITLEIHYYDLAGNASNTVTTSPVRLYAEHPDSGWLYDERGGRCGCTQGPGLRGPWGALPGLLLLWRRRR